MKLEQEFNELLKEKGFRYFRDSFIDDNRFNIDVYGIGKEELSDDEIRQTGWMFNFADTYTDNARYQKMIYTITDTFPETDIIFK